MKWVFVFGVLGTLAMSGALINGFTAGSFFEDGGELLRNPWGIVSLVDLYVGFVLFSLWIVYRESNAVVMALWVIAMMVLGFFTASVYIAYHSYRHLEDDKAFLLGKHHQKT